MGCAAGSWERPRPTRGRRAKEISWMNIQLQNFDSSKQSELRQVLRSSKYKVTNTERHHARARWRWYDSLYEHLVLTRSFVVD